MPTVPVIPSVWPSSSEWFFLSPVLLMAFWGVLVLMLDVLVLRNRTLLSTRAKWLGLTSLVGALAALGLAVGLLWPGVLATDVLSANEEFFNGTIAFDAASALLQVVGIGFLVLVIGLSMTWVFTNEQGEYYALLFWSAVGMILMIEAEEFMTLFVALETMTISIYILTGLETGSKRSSEAALKYLIYGSAASALFLFGLSWVYGLTGTTRLAAVGRALVESRTVEGIGGQWTSGLALLLVLAGFGFKVASVPFHQWTPDVYEGAPAPVTAWIASGSKFASFIAMIKVLMLALGTWSVDTGHLQSPGWVVILSILAAVSMTYGNLAALGQQNFKRMLAYSSIAHSGYLLVGVVAIGVSSQRTEATGAVLYYLCTYGLATLGTFAVAAWLAHDVGSDQIDDLNGLGFRRPVPAFCLAILLLSLIGVPPLAGFFGKMLMFMEALNAGGNGGIALTWLVVVALLNSVVSAFYYDRVLKALYLRQPGPAIGKSFPSGVIWTLVIAAVATVGFGLNPTALLDPLGGAGISLLTSPEPASSGRPVDSNGITQSATVPENPAQTQVPVAPAPSASAR